MHMECVDEKTNKHVTLHGSSATNCGLVNYEGAKNAYSHWNFNHLTPTEKYFYNLLPK